MKAATRLDYQARIARVVAAIEANPGRPLAIQHLASIAALSPYHFHRIYQAIQGETVIETVRRIRMARASFALSSTQQPVIEIALECGYESAASFSRAFKALLGVTPSEFRHRRMIFAAVIPGPRPFNLQETAMTDLAVTIARHDPIPRVFGWTRRLSLTDIGDHWKALWAVIVQAGLADACTLAVGLSMDAPDDKGMLLYTAAVQFREGTAPPRQLAPIEIPGGLYATHRLTGPYSGIGPAFQRLFGQWLPASGEEIDSRPVLEIYRNNVYSTPENELITDLMIPVRAR